MNINFSEWGMKELYDIVISANYAIDYNGGVVNIGEPLLLLDKVEIGNFTELKTFTDASGGKDNSPRVSWEHTSGIDILLSKGTFSFGHLALLSNSKTEKSAGLEVSKNEYLESDEEGVIDLKFSPISKEKTYIYHKTSGQPYLDFELSENKITNLPAYKEFTIIYYFTYGGGAEIINLGDRNLKGYLTLTGKTKVKNGETGQTVTGILRIPKMKLMSELSMRLGESAHPIISNFQVRGLPSGIRGSSRVMEMVFLDSNIDSDF